MAKESKYGTMAALTMDNGRTIKPMDLAVLLILKEIVMRDFL